MAGKFEELNVLDDFLINAIASDLEVKETYMKFEEIMAYREEVGFTRGEKAGELMAKRRTIVE